MTIQDLGSIGELVAAIATVATLLYLAHQIRQNTKVARSSMRHGITDSVAETGRVLAEGDQLALLMQKHIDGSDLEPHEYLRLQAFAYMGTRNWENIHYQYVSGMLTRQEWGAFRENLKILYQGSLWQDYWARERDIYTEAFQSEIDTLLGEIRAGKRVGDDSVLFGRGRPGGAA